MDAEGELQHFKSERIEFHVPAEHVLDGIQPDLEMQIIHRIKGSDKHVILSVLFSIIENEAENINHKRSLSGSYPYYSQ